MLRIWQAGVEEVRALLEDGWDGLVQRQVHEREPDHRAEQQERDSEQGEAEERVASRLLGSRLAWAGSRARARGRSCEHRIERHRDEERREVRERVVEEQRGPGGRPLTAQVPRQAEEAGSEGRGRDEVDQPELAPQRRARA